MRIFRELFTVNPDSSREEKRNDFDTVRLEVEGFAVVYRSSTTRGVR